jgi:hypothetical protein
MERIDDTAGLELLQRANACFTDFFAHFSSAPSAAPDEELRALLQLHEALQSVGALLDGRLQRSLNRETSVALDGYRRNLIRLRRQLTLMEQSATSRRGRLDIRQQHLTGARAWCAASRAIS